MASVVSELLEHAERGEGEDVASRVTEWAEPEIVEQAIRLADGDQTKAAQWLGISRATLREKLSRSNLRLALKHAQQGDGACSLPFPSDL